METLLNHDVTLQELRKVKETNYSTVEGYKELIPCFVKSRKNQDIFYKEIAELYDLRGNPAKAAEYRAKIKDKSVLKPYVFQDWCGPGKQSDYQPMPEPERLAA
jgi:hypothetical protein